MTASPAGPGAPAAVRESTRPSVPGSPNGKVARSIVFFDGACGFCSGAVAMLMRADRRRNNLQFEPLQGEIARQHLHREHTADDTIWLMQDGRLHSRSGAVLRVLFLLGWPWRAAALLLLVPRPLRDWAYNAVARRRHGRL